MPELPEVHTVMLSLKPKVINKKIISTEIYLDKIIKQQTVETFKERIINSTITNCDRRGKYIVVTLSKNNIQYYLIIHLGMTGACFVTNNLNNLDEKYRKHTHAILNLDNGQKLIYTDIRRFGGLRVFTVEQYHQLFKNMGPEPFWDNAEEEFLKRVKRKLYRTRKLKDGSKIKEPIVIKEAILDQNNVAGIGNIYACESLLYSNVLPTKPVYELTDDKLREIFRNARDIMKFSISVGGSSISDYVDSDGNTGSMQNYLLVYGRKICGKCNSKVEKIEVAGRGTYYCPNCQK